MKIYKLLPLAVLALVIGLASCTGEDGTDGLDGLAGVTGDKGDPGTNGNNGVNCWDTNGNGQNDPDEDLNKDGEFNALDCRGTDGDDGDDGENGVGFDELTKYGYITLKLEGTRPDNVVFQDSTAFKFYSVSGNYMDDVNNLSISEEGEDITHMFDFQRFLSAPDDVYQESYVYFDLDITNLGESDEVIDYLEIEIYGYTVLGQDNKYFVIKDAHASDEVWVTGFELADLSFDEETNHLSFSYSLNVDAENNDSENDLSISGEVDVIVFEEINSGGGDNL